MKRFGFILIAFIIIGFNAFSQNYFNKLYRTVFDINIGGAIDKIDDGYIILGTVVTTQDRKILLIKLNKKGDTVWQKTYGSPPLIFYGQKIVAIKDGFVIAGGMKDSSNTNNSDMMLIKFDLNGTFKWLKRYGGIKFDAARNMKRTLDGGYILVGPTSSYGLGVQNVYVVKTDSLGNKQWENYYGGNSTQDAHGLALTNDGGYIISGATNSFSGNYDHYIIKIDSLGNKQWEKVYGTPYDDYSGAIIQLNDKNYLFATASPNGAGKTYSKLMKFNQNGNIIWQKNYSYGNYSSFITAPIENNDGTIVTGAIYDPTPASKDLGYLLKVNAIGDTLWSKTYYVNPKISNYFYDLIKTIDGGFIACGSGVDTANIQYAWVVKTDCMGNDSIHYAKQNGCCNLYAANIISNKTNYTFCKGDSATLTIQPAYNSYQWSTGAATQSIKVKQGGNYTVTITNSNSCTLGIQPTIVQVDTMPVPVISIKNKDTLQSNYSIGNRWFRNGQLIIAAIGPIYATAGVGGTYTVVVTNTCGTGTSQALVVTGINELGSSKFESLKVWPNPVTEGILNINSTDAPQGIEIYNILGERILQSNISQQIDVSRFPKGVYTVIINSKRNSVAKKVIIQ